ncbi:MAG TPA: hypothetical protein VFL72_05780 [Acidimicrobiia bacterium]|nr:hypothetical protein [Acidimicrobiia bacterium]
MPDDLSNLADPGFILVAWSAGLALVSGLVALARLVGPGFTWVAASVAVLVGLGGAFGGDTWWVRLGLLLAALGLITARNRQLSGLFQVSAGIALAIQAMLLGGWAPALSATIALGGVTGEMLLGHWYLVDPRLPRWALKSLAIAGIVGLVLDSVVLAVAGLPSGGATIAFWVLMATSVILMAAVFAALRYPAYAGVMAATGLSYLAVLTSLAAVFLGRVLVAGLGPFGS